MSDRELSPSHKPNEEAVRDRRMVSATLMGKHQFHAGGVGVTICLRDGKYMARGRYRGRQFGPTLGSDETTAQSALIRLLAELDEGRFVQPSESRATPIPRRAPGRITLRELAADFLAEKRKTRGKRTMVTLGGRLAHAVEFTELPENRRHWANVAEIDRDFAVEFKAFLGSRKVAPNGRPGAAKRLMSQASIVNVMESLRGLLNWGKSAAVAKLSPSFVNPLTADLVGVRPQRDPLRKNCIPVELRARLLDKADRWQFFMFAMWFVLPCRPEEFCGLLVSDVDFEARRLRFGDRFGGADFTKGRQSFVVPFPAELEPVLQALVRGRREGPLLRSCRAFDNVGVGELDSVAALEDVVAKALASERAVDMQTPQDRKNAIRKLFRHHGGVSIEQAAKEFDRLQKNVLGERRFTLKDLRHAVTQDFRESGVERLEARFMTGHTTKDILNTYSGLGIDREIAKYFIYVRPLLEVIASKCAEFGLSNEA